MPQAAITNFAKGSNKHETVPDSKLIPAKKRSSESTVAEKLSKKEKKAKDPQAPKKPTCAYFFFLNDKRAAYMKENPTSKVGDVAKGLAEVWSKLTDEQKKPYEVKAEEDRKRYAEEMKGYKPPAGLSTTNSSKKPKKQKDPNAPKKALSAYMLFSIAMGPKIRAENKADPKSAMSKIAEAWKEADAETKENFEKQAAEDKVRYDKAMQEYRKGGGADAAEAGDEEDGEADAAEESSAEEEEEENPAPKKKPRNVIHDDDE